MNRLKQLRTENDLTQEELGGLIGVSKRTIIAWEKAEQLSLKTDKAQALADHFKVSVAYLLGDSDFKTPQEEMKYEILNQDKFYLDYGGDSETPIDPYRTLAISTIGKNYEDMIREKLLSLAENDLYKSGKYINAITKLPINLQLLLARYLLLTESRQKTVDDLLFALFQTNNDT